MGLFISIAIGALFGAGLYMVMSNSFIKLVVGLMLLSQGVVTLILVSGSLRVGKSPILPLDTEFVDVPDPLPQAMVLTAIVISFAFNAFWIVLVRQSYLSSQAKNPDSMRGRS